MHLTLSKDRLSFDPLKPVLLRGAPTEDASSIFQGNVVLSLAKPTKISSISVTYKSTATTYWPQGDSDMIASGIVGLSVDRRTGIGPRGTRLTHTTVLREETIQLLESKEEKKLSTGIHRFSFVFVIPNSTVETIEDMYGKVEHVAEARVVSPGILMMNNMQIRKNFLVLRTYMSNALLTNNSVQDLSRTFEKQVSAADIKLIVEQAVFSSGDLFYLRLVVQPHRKRTRLERMEVMITETRKYCVQDLQGAYSLETEDHVLPFISSTRLEDVDGSVTTDESDELKPVFEKGGHAIEFMDTMAYRIKLATPTCVRNLHHTTHFKEILIRHRLSIQLKLSYPTNPPSRPRTAPVSRNNSSSSIPTLSDPSSSCTVPSSPTLSASTASTDSVAVVPSLSHGNNAGGWHTVFSKILRQRTDKDPSEKNRKQDIIKLEIPVTVFDCRLKEDFGRLPSYSELASQPESSSSSSGFIAPSKPVDRKQAPRTSQKSIQIDKPTNFDPHVFLCQCYYTFRQEMQLAAEAEVLTQPERNTSLERLPSKPPPEYVD
ncbi:hypothetical protein EC973_009623 [Apophysomyces ossiformis]|uniref:Arrestin-like N-terminal domain-containing protein n=1 Tax=Apophysomyces ossiformis TaxID=679940 RepID=A0A8H7BR56_9FUNG|nr:hypothetical protein EC973_009623 [Apophysomyces ossiformis]